MAEPEQTDASSPADRLRVLTWNMQYGQGWDPADPDNAPIALSAVEGVLRESLADVVFLQEVEQVVTDRPPLEPPPHFTRLQANGLYRHSAFTYPPADSEELPFGYGLAIFSRLPLHNVEAIPLPAPDITFPFRGRTHCCTQRALLKAEAELPDGSHVALLNTHLQAFFMIETTADEHPAQRERVGQAVKEARHPVILAGDFNVAPEEGTIRYFESLGLNTQAPPVVTWKRRPYKLDYILAGAPWQVRHLDVQPTMASDHELVVADVVRTAG